MVIADMGSVRPGVPTLTVALRGMAMATIEVTTLEGAKHSGQFGGAAPDALLVLLRALASLHDEHGDVAVAGLDREEWTGESYSDDEFRELAEVLPGLPLQGTGGLGSRVWSGPAITVTGIDVPSVGERAQRRLAVRAREDQPARAPRAGRRRGAGGARAPPRGACGRSGSRSRSTREETGNGFSADTTGPAYEAARAAYVGAPGAAPAVNAAGGGSIPLVSALQAAAPKAEVLLVGATDGYSNIHAPDERVLLDELEKATAAEAAFFGEYAKRWS